MKAVISNRLFLTPQSQEDHATTKALMDITTIKNPKYIENEIQDRSQWGKVKGKWVKTPEFLQFFEVSESGDTISFPRRLFIQLPLNLPYQDKTISVFQDFPAFQGELHSYQENAVSSLFNYTEGIIQAPTGAGKTVMGVNLVIRRRQSTLVIVHTKELQAQWVEAFQKFAGIPAKEIGQIGGGKKTIGDRVTVAIINSLVKMLETEDCVKLQNSFGLVIVDECHRTPSKTFSQAIDSFPSKYKFGFSATPYRRDKMGKLMEWYIGPIRYEIKPEDLMEKGYIMRPEIRIIPTDFDYDYNDDYPKMISYLTNDDSRNSLITRKIKEEGRVQKDGVILVVSDRQAHLHRLAREISNKAILTGSTPAKQRSIIVEKLRNGEIKYLFSTVQLIGEGFDLPSISRIFLACPMRWKGRLIQAVGRALRSKKGKDTPVIYDFADMNVGVLRAGCFNRKRVYRNELHADIKEKNDDFESLFSVN